MNSLFVNCFAHSTLAAQTSVVAHLLGLVAVAAAAASNRFFNQSLYRRNGEVLGWSDWHKSFKLGHFFGWLSVPLVAAGPAGAVKVAVGDSVSVSVARQLLEPGVAPQPIVNPLRC